MSVVTVYARLYESCFADTGRAIAKNWWTILLPMGLGGALQVTGMFLGALPPLVAGIALALATDAALSSYFYFVGEMVGRQKVAVKDFRRSFGAYFWSILNLMFIFWIARFVLGFGLRGVPQGGIIYAGLLLVAAIALNAAPEVIYQRRTYGGLQTIQASWEFLKENWLPWFLPTLPLVAVVVAATAASSALGLIASSIIGGALVHLVMVFRGFLFNALDGSSHRQRMFKFRNQLA